jgi:hypothetical protein
MGKILAGDAESYQYLVESIERFPSQPEFAQLYVAPAPSILSTMSSPFFIDHSALPVDHFC